MGIDFCNDTERLHLVLLFGGKRDLDVKPLYTYLCPVIIIVCFLSIIFNAILVSISRQSKVVNKSPILLLSLNLALTDLIASLFNGLGILLNSYLPEVYDIKVGQCSMLMFEVVRCAALVASALHLLALAFVHYRGIVDPLHYRSTIFFSQHLSRAINIISLCCWIIPLTIMIAWFSSSPCQGFQSDDCDYLFLLGFSFRHMVLAMFALPLLFMSVIYLRIFIIISRHQKGRRQNQERITLSRGVMSATGPIGTTAAAVDLTELIAERDDEIEGGEEEGAGLDLGGTRCPACMARALMNEDQSISILSEETMQNADTNQCALVGQDIVSAIGETSQHQNDIKSLTQKSVSVKETPLTRHNSSVGNAINSSDNTKMVPATGISIEKSPGIGEEQTTYTNNLANERNTSSDNTSLSSCSDANNNNIVESQKPMKDNTIGQGPVGDDQRVVKDRGSDISDKRRDYGKGSESPYNEVDCDRIHGKKNDGKLRTEKRKEKGGGDKRSGFFFLMRPIMGRRSQSGDNTDQPKVELTPPVMEANAQERNSQNLTSRSVMMKTNTRSVKMETDDEKFNGKGSLKSEACKLGSSPRSPSPGDSKSTNDDDDSSSSSSSSSRSSSSSSSSSTTTTTSSSSSSSFSSEVAETIFKRKKHYSLTSARMGVGRQNVSSAQKINRINPRLQLRAQFSLGTDSGGGGGCGVEAGRQQRKGVQLLTLQDTSRCAANGDVSQSGGRKQSVGETTTTKTLVHRQQSNPVSGDSLLTWECTCDNRLQQFDRSRKLSRSNTIGGAHNAGGASSVLVRDASRRQYIAKMRAKQEQQRKAALVALTGSQGSSISSSAVASQQQQQQLLLLPPLKKQHSSGAIKHHRFSSLKSNLHKLSASNSATNTGSRYGLPPTTTMNFTSSLSSQKILANQLHQTTAATTISNASTYEPQRRHIHASAVPQTNTKALVTTLLILGTYFISYVPAIIYQVLTCVDNCPYPLYTISFRRRIYLGAMTTLLLIAKSIIDPFIYSYRMSEIQVAITRYLSKRRSKTSMATSMYTSQRFNKSFNNAQNYNNTNINHSIANNNNNTSIKHNVDASIAKTKANSSSKILSHNHHRHHHHHHHRHGRNNNNHQNSNDQTNNHQTHQLVQHAFNRHRRFLPKQLTDGTTTSSSDPTANQNQTLSTITTTTTATTTTTIFKHESKNDTQQEPMDELTTLISTSTKSEGPLNLVTKFQDKEETAILLEKSSFKLNGKILNDLAENVQVVTEQT